MDFACLQYFLCPPPHWVFVVLRKGKDVVHKKDQAARAEKQWGRTREREKGGGNNKRHTRIFHEVKGFGAFKPLVGLFILLSPKQGFCWLVAKMTFWWLPRRWREGSGKRGRDDAFSLHGSDGDPARQKKGGLVNTAVGWSLWWTNQTRILGVTQTSYWPMLCCVVRQ